MTQATSTRPRTQTSRHTRVLIIGAGFGGLGAAIRLTRDRQLDFIVLEKSHEVGGTWRQNTYPGCECDIPPVLYSYSFEAPPDWARTRAAQPDILDYLSQVTDKYRLRSKIDFGTEVESCRWDEATGRWHVVATSGRVYVAQFLIVGTGALNVPKIPKIPGAETFRGTAFHSARWEHDVDLTSRKVAVIGTGASAIQLIPEIGGVAGEVQVYQRTPAWILPRRSLSLPTPAQRLLDRIPLSRRTFRNIAYWSAESVAVGLNGHPAPLRALERRAVRHLHRQVSDPELRRALTPDYRIGCKRILRSQTYYPALTRPGTEVITQAIGEIRPHSIVTRDGTERPVDVIVYATGFHVSGSLARMPLVGRDGESLMDRWRQTGPRTHLGIMVSGFPNAFLLSGPNTGLGHNSVLLMVEAQIDYALAAMNLVDRRGCAALDVRPETQERFGADVQRRLANTVWTTGGCTSWYLDARGVNHSLWPGFSWQYWLRTRRVDRRGYDFLGARPPDTGEQVAHSPRPGPR